MVDCLLDLVLRPGESELPPVQVLLTVVASVATLLGGDAPGEVDGQVVPAELVRQLLRGLTGSHPAAGGEDRPWEIEREELARWWAEMERRVLARELHGEPERPPDPGRPDPPAPDGRSPIGVEADPDRDAAADSDLDLGVGRDPDAFLDHDLDGDPDLDVDVDRAGLADPDPPADRNQPPPHGWWAAADHAVEDAAAAVHAATLALGSARRRARTAERADTAEETAWAAGPA
ncbi:hypothetical protein ACI782_22725, partial [Geodermatophilus sp. SYSU D00703]